ncbi:MAG TPA: heme-binding protein [Terriglobia bacterium]|nr:heme-binding protein [Terriglobia bacterium]
MNTRTIVASLAFSLGAAAFANAQVVEKKGLSLVGARTAIAAAVSEARKRNTTGVIAVVDEGGNLMAVERIDGTFSAGANISIGKARTAALFKRPTKVFEDAIKNGRTAMVALPDSLFTPLQGGIPIEIDGTIVGAIGVSGASSAQEDEELAIIGAGAAKRESMSAAMDSRPSAGEITFLEAERVNDAFKKGEVLVNKGSYMIHASHRDANGMAEVHTDDTDIIYVLEGSATFVTGGSVVDPSTVAPGEIRGPSVRDGQSRTIARGDVIVVPNGVPHWFEQVSGPLNYYVVKVRRGAEGSGNND